jgi:hypothetical protein
MAGPDKTTRWKDLMGRLIILLVGIPVMILAAAAVGLYLVDSPTDLEFRGRLYLLFKQTDKAINAYTRLTQIAPHDQQAFVRVGHLYAAKGAYASAFPFFAKAAELDASVPNLLHAGVAAQRSGLNEEASRYYRRVLRTDPENVTAAANLALVQPPDQPSAPAETPTAVDNQLNAKGASKHDAAGMAESFGGPPPAGQEPSMLPTPRRSLPCDLLLRETKRVMKHGQSDWLVFLTLRVGPPYRRCASGQGDIYCFRCRLRGGLTDSVEIMERDGLVSGYFFGSCACQKKDPTRGTDKSP